LYPTGNIIFLTGHRDTGKTIICEQLINGISGTSKKITGVLSPGRYENNRKTGIFCLDIATGEKKLLANYFPSWDPKKPQREWEFNQETLDWGNDVLGKSVPTDLLVIDEIGYLEFDKNKGWTNALAALDSRKFQYGLVVVRPSLIENALKRYPPAEVKEVSSLETRNLIIQELIHLFSASP